jgi:molecular chaperone DnaK (HSP70)
MKEVENVLKNGNLALKNVDEIYLVGGATRVPLVRTRLEQIFTKDKIVKSYT